MWAVAAAGLAAAWAGRPAPTLVVVRGGAERVVVAEAARGYPAAGLGDLAAALGYAWSADVIELEGERVEFTAGLPYFRAGGRLHQLAHAPYRAAGALMISLQWASEWLPGALPARWRYRDGRLESLPSPRRASDPPPTRERDRWVVVVDAGHGGIDPGAIGPRGTREKDVALGVARALARALEDHPQIEVVMTRRTDTLVALDDRPKIANRAAGDLFLSIHTNALPRPNVAGFETYFLAVAKTEDAARVAQMENAAVRFDRGAAGVELDPITFMLRDLVQNAYLIESLRWAELVQASLAESIDAPNRGVKQAGFYVLVGANMPSVLVEIGYLTNPQEEQQLRSPTYQRRVAEALARSIETYLRTYGRRFRYVETAR